jgi:2-polyprenyl-3-methyl-5-hydroxy-6-metoxy-1,4-benzoquinol methylase
VRTLKLPSRALLKNGDQLFLYQYDQLQFFNKNPRHPDRFYYESRFLHLLNKIAQILPGGSIIDLACAQANFTISLAGKDYELVGLDLRRSFLQYAKLKVEKTENENLNFIVGNVECLPVNSESFDGIILGELLEHTSRPESVVIEAKRILKPGGYLFITTPNGERLTPDRRRTYSDLKNLNRNWKGIEFAPDTHVFEFLKIELGQLILGSNLELISLRYFGLARSLAPVLCSIPFPTSFLRKIEEILVRIPLIKRKIAGTLVCICRKKQI